jgi:hypothetical protein
MVNNIKEKKSFGGNLVNCKIIPINITQDLLDAFFPNENLKPYIITGELMDEICEDHVEVRSSLICSIDKENNVIETRNAVYQVIDNDDLFLSLPHIY